jgi:hypothetical protein
MLTIRRLLRAHCRAYGICFVAKSLGEWIMVNFQLCYLRIEDKKNVLFSTINLRVKISNIRDKQLVCTVFVLTQNESGFCF